MTRCTSKAGDRSSGEGLRVQTSVDESVWGEIFGKEMEHHDKERILVGQRDGGQHQLHRNVLRGLEFFGQDLKGEALGLDLSLWTEERASWGACKLEID